MAFHVRSGPWSPSQIEAWLSDTVVPLRLATAGRRGPLVQSVWFRYADGRLWCATQRDSVLAKRVGRDPAVGWEVSPDEPPYRGVRGTGRAELLQESPLVAEVLAGLIERYGQSDTALAQWLLSRVETELLVTIGDLRITSWDFTPRM